MGLTASMRQSLRLVGDGDSSQLDLGLSQSISLSFDKSTERCINMIISVCVVFMCVLLCAYVVKLHHSSAVVLWGCVWPAG